MFMDKYTKALTKFITIPIGIICILVGLAFIGVSVWVSTFSDIASMILIPALFGGGMIINFGVGYAFLGDKYKATNLVHDGNTMYAPVKTTNFLIRRKIVTLIGFIAYVLLAIYYVVRLILVCVYMQYLIDIDFQFNIIALIIFAVISLILAVIIFLIYKKTKHIDLNQN